MPHILSTLDTKTILAVVAVIIGIVIFAKGMNTTPGGGNNKGNNNSSNNNSNNSNNSSN